MDDPAVIIIGVIILVIILRAISRRGEAGVANQGRSASSASVTPRLAEAQLRHEPAGDESPDRYDVQLRGAMLVRPGSSPVASVMIVDVTAGAPLPVIALLNEQQADDSPIFLFQHPFGMWKSSILGSSDWVSLASIWPETLRAPFSGRRHLKVWVRFDDQFDSDEVFFFESLDLSVELSEMGWQEFPERRMADEVAMVRLAMGVAAASDGLHEAELKVIKKWATEQVAFLDPEPREQNKKRLNAAIRKAAQEATGGGIDLAEEIDRLHSKGTPGGRLEAIELCLAVSTADGTADKEELNRINRIADRLGVDRDWFSGARDKALRGSKIEADQAEDLAALLGIDPRAPKDEIRRELTAQYDRWSSRSVSLESQAGRDEAERMLDLIARAREEFK